MTGASGDKPRRGWLLPALLVSLALNLVVLGLVASSLWKHPHGGPRIGKFERVAIAVDRFIPELPEAKREAVRQQLAQSREETKLLGEKIQQLRDQIRSIFISEGYDEAKIRETLELLRSARTEQGRSMSEAALLLVRDLNREQRTRFLETVRSKEIRRP
ncbi:MAG: periplasmic heavy metal sensor [Hyphomicrobiales bacterium]